MWYARSAAGLGRSRAEVYAALDDVGWLRIAQSESFVPQGTGDWSWSPAKETFGERTQSSGGVDTPPSYGYGEWTNQSTTSCARAQSGTRDAPRYPGE